MRKPLRPLLIAQKSAYPNLSARTLPESSSTDRYLHHINRECDAFEPNGFYQTHEKILPAMTIPFLNILSTRFPLVMTAAKGRFHIHPLRETPTSFHKIAYPNCELTRATETTEQGKNFLRDNRNGFILVYFLAISLMRRKSRCAAIARYSTE